MAKFSFISNLEEDSKAPKTKFQLFEAELGFERVEILVPFDNADIFLEEATLAKPRGRSELSRIAAKYAGTVK